MPEAKATAIVRNPPRWLPWLGGKSNRGDAIFRGASRFFALLVVALLVAMAYEMARASTASFEEFGWRFIISRDWDPVNEQFGALPFIYGTVVSSLLALFIAVPVALGLAIYLAELAPLWLRKPVGFLEELLAAVPSVVYGL